MKININQDIGKEAINNLLDLTSKKETEQERYKQTQECILKGVFEE